MQKSGTTIRPELPERARIEPRTALLDGDVLVVFRAQPPGLDGNGATPAQRLRRALKFALRSCSLRCIQIQEPGVFQ